MTLSNKVPALLDDCAKVLTARKGNNLDLTALFPTFYRKGGMDEIVSTLIGHVERYSDGTRTVRPAHKALFRYRIKNTGLYLAYCPISTSEDTVAELRDDMALAMLRPCGDGLTVGAERASYKDIERGVSLRRALEPYFESR